MLQADARSPNRSHAPTVGHNHVAHCWLLTAVPGAAVRAQVPVDHLLQQLPAGGEWEKWKAQCARAWTLLNKNASWRVPARVPTASREALVQKRKQAVIGHQKSVLRRDPMAATTLPRHACDASTILSATCGCPACTHLACGMILSATSSSPK